MSEGSVDRESFRTSWRRTLSQSLLAAASISAIMLGLDLLLQTAIVTTLGATTFIVFAMPNAKPAQTKRLLGGYLIGMAAGIFCWALAEAGLPNVLGLSDHVGNTVLAGVAVGIATLVMVLARMEHPPAAGLALGLVLDDWSLATLIFVAGAVTSLALLHRAFHRLIADLV